VTAAYRIVAGDPVVVGRIHFEGNKRIKEKFLRRELKLNEGEIYDSAKLDQSIQRINKNAIVEELQRTDAMLEMNEKTGNVDITIKVKEKDRQGIYGTGGTGGIGGGYVGILYTAFDLLRLGESLSLKLDGGASRSDMLLDIVGTRFPGFPFSLGFSIFNRLTNFNVAGLVPDGRDLIQFLKHHAKGVGLSGAYPVTGRIQMGLGAQLSRISSTQEASENIPDQKTVENRVDFTPLFRFDSTRGSGPGVRGTRLAFTQSWSGTSFVKSMDSSAQSFRLSKFTGDPFAKGKNAVAFGFQGAIISPRNGKPLSLDRRYFPGDEIVRGFPRGGLTPWIQSLDGGSLPAPAGADTILGGSLEYRIPIHGPLSSAAFVDLGWSRLSARNVDADTGSRLIETTNRVLRGSAGGELRLQLPVIRQPGRMIFSWNFLRLNDAILSRGSLLRLADPRGTIRFALGERF
jgi:outer membrane protein insertion porin family